MSARLPYPDGTLELALLPDALAICRLDPATPLPPWAQEGAFHSITRTVHELSVVCAEHLVPGNVRCERGWRCLAVNGPLDFTLTGVLAGLAAPLAEAGISIITISTFDTDYLLVKQPYLQQALEVLVLSGFVVHGGERP